MTDTISPTDIITHIPALSDADVVFGGGVVERAYDTLAPIARRQTLTWGGDFFSRVFFSGGVAPEFKPVDGVTPDDQMRVLRFLKAAMRSWYPKHEDKEAVCGMLWEAFFVNPQQ